MDFGVGHFNLPVGGNSDFRMEDFDPQMEDFDDELGGFDFSIEGMNLQMADNNYQVENMEYLLDNFAYDNFTYDNPNPTNVSGNQPGRNETIGQAPDREASDPSSPDSQVFVNHFEWTENNLPIGVSFDPNAPAVTPEFLRGWTYRPGHAEELEDENQVIFAYPSNSIPKSTTTMGDARDGFQNHFYYTDRRPSMVSLLHTNTTE
ncbi:hypothetical protein GL218_06443 [Daldinia childiae]|uniref:uncharacterized protein n=1 Tax=Daldinia childiae TaxID=326645 RepID=UPI0014481AF5|nr:uncharacterized protein GL218_06443 [Daldinia childiae]KAF3056253.1 hypothetical protein GL218_06443 [Daldinia childiae]